MDRILMHISFLIIMLFYKSESICDKKSRGSDKSCSKYGTCDECIACDSYCSWCHVGGMCTKFCEGEDGAACKSPDCAKKSEFICASMGESHSSGVDYKKEGGIDLEMKGVMASAGREIDKPGAPVRPFSPFAHFQAEPDRQLRTNT